MKCEHGREIVIKTEAWEGADGAEKGTIEVAGCSECEGVELVENLFGSRVIALGEIADLFDDE